MTQPVAVREQVVVEERFCRLLHFARDLRLPRNNDPYVMVVAPLSGHHSTLLRGTVEALLPRPRRLHHRLGRRRKVPLRRGASTSTTTSTTSSTFLRALGPGPHVIAVCQPSVPVLAAAALMAAAGTRGPPR